MFSILIPSFPNEEDELIARLWEAGTTGIVEEPGSLRAFFEDGVDVSAFPNTGVRQESNQDWAQQALDSFHPILIGQRFYLTPTWRKDPTPEGRLRLEVLPGAMCGTGYHQSTQLCIENFERFLKPGMRVLDVGSGSGILCDAARLLGAGFIAGCDIDEDSVQRARERVTAPMFAGSVDAVASESFDLIVANISAAATNSLAEEFHRVRRPESTLILSGFIATDEIEGYQVRQRFQKDDWVSLVC